MTLQQLLLGQQQGRVADATVCLAGKSTPLALVEFHGYSGLHRQRQL